MFLNYRLFHDRHFSDRPGNSSSKTMATKCCSGLCIDLLRKFEAELGFTYELQRVEDPKWGTFQVNMRYGMANMP